MGWRNEQPNSGGYNGGSLGGVAGILGLAGGLYNAYQDRKTARENTDKTIAAQRAEAELAYQRNLEMWRMQNDYNSPEAQMARYRSAGLNSHMIYGQGSPGNASTPPAYQPPDIQYRYAAGNYGESIAQIIPTLMSVGSWIQSMRESEVNIRSKETGISKAQQAIDQLSRMNPELYEKLKNSNSLFPYQSRMASYSADQAENKLFEWEQAFRNEYGQELFEIRPKHFKDRDDNTPLGGMKRLKFLQEKSKSDILDAKASWTNMNITDPQALIMMVMQGVMGMAGAQLRVPKKSATNPRTRTTEDRLRNIQSSGRKFSGDLPPWATPDAPGRRMGDGSWKYYR